MTSSIAFGPYQSTNIPRDDETTLRTAPTSAKTSDKMTASRQNTITEYLIVKIRPPYNKKSLFVKNIREHDEQNVSYKYCLIEIVVWQIEM